MENSQKGFILPIIGATIAIIIVIGGIAYLANKSTVNNKDINQTENSTMTEEDKSANNQMMNEKGVDSVIEDENTTMMNDNKTEPELMMTYSGSVLAGNSAPLLDFNQSDYEAALKTDKLIVLYFYANWCPVCRAEFPLMQQAFNDLNSDQVVGFRVNYNDNETDNSEKNLARQFGVAYQHTKVFVKNNNRILKSPEGWDTGRYTSEINKIINQ